MELLVTLFVGLVVGVLAKLLMPGRDPSGIVITILLGVAGALMAGWLASAAGLFREPFAGPGLVVSVLGATLLLLVYRFATGRLTAPGRSRRDQSPPPRSK